MNASDTTIRQLFDNKCKVILASQSARRRELLGATGIDFDVVPPDPSAEPEGASPCSGETTANFVERLAYQKAFDVASRITYPAIIIGCDTVADADGLILRKPVDRDDARRILKLLSGRRHSIWSGLCLIHTGTNRHWLGRAESRIDMKPLSESELDEYLDSGAWQGKSGAFGYQDDHPWLQLISGTADNVVGLPIDLLCEGVKALA